MLSIYRFYHEELSQCSNLENGLPIWSVMLARCSLIFLDRKSGCVLVGLVYTSASLIGHSGTDVENHATKELYWMLW